MLKLWTGRVPECNGENVIDITYKTQHPIGKIFAPTKDLVHRYKYQGLHRLSYLQEYDARVAARAMADMDKIHWLFDQQEITFTCWEMPFEFCHRFRAADSLVRSTVGLKRGPHSIRYMGERNVSRKTMCVTAHRKIVPPGWGYGSYWCNPGVYGHQRKVVELVKKELRVAIAVGYCNFISGGAIGGDTMFAEAVEELKGEFKGISSLIARPFGNQPSQWNSVSQERYNEMLLKADNVITVGPNPHPGDKRSVFVLMDDRNKFMVNNSHEVLAIWNGRRKGGTWNCIRYAHSTGKPILVLDPNTLRTYKY